MSYEITIPLKVGTLEIEFDNAAQLERRLRALDVARVERAVLAAVHGAGPKPERKAKRAGKKKRA